MRIVSELLLEESAFLPDGGRWLVLGGEAALVRELARSEGTHVSWMPVDSRERDLISADVVVRDAEREGLYDRVLLPLPPDRDLARRWLLVARDIVTPGGDVLVAGANAEGAKSSIADAARVFGPPISDGYRQKHRFARFPQRVVPTESLPDWVTADGIVPGTWQRFMVTLDGEEIALDTQPGVFAGNRLDAGTSLLLAHLAVSEGDQVLDIGCGAGVIGVAAHRRGAASVDMVDANLLAVQAAARNAARLSVPGRVVAGNVYEPVRDSRYDLIVSNPPFHRGKDIDLSVADRLIGEAPRHLLPGGRILIVANAFLAYGKAMQRVFRQVETIAATRQYHVLHGSDPIAGASIHQHPGPVE
jgi:16S rRNA (guanine1207-N2)-methyltransferase